MANVLVTPEVEALVGRPMWDSETALVRQEDILRYLEMLGDSVRDRLEDEEKASDEKKGAEES